MAVTEYVKQAELPKVFKHSLAKVEAKVEVNCVVKSLSSEKRLSHRIVPSSNFTAYYVRTPGYFCQFYDFAPTVRHLETGVTRHRGELYSDSFKTARDLQESLAVLNSTLFYWYMFTFSDCRHMNRRDVLNFPIDFDRFSADERIKLANLSEQLQQDLRINKGTMLKSGLEIQTFDASKSKQIIDDIDGVLAEHYGFTDEELDFIINYDIKYCMGQDNGDEGENGNGEE